MATYAPSSDIYPTINVTVTSSGTSVAASTDISILFGVTDTTDTSPAPTVAPATPTLITDLATLKTQFGANSDIVNLYNGYYANNPGRVLYAVSSATATVSDIQAALATITSIPFKNLVHSFNTSANIQVIETFLEQEWDYTTMLDPMSTTAVIDTEDSLATLGNSLNTKFSVVAGQATGTTDNAASLAGRVAAAIDLRSSENVAYPIQNIELLGAVSSGLGKGFNRVAANALFDAGITPITEDYSGTVYLRRAITTYKKDDAGDADTSYRDVETILSLNYLSASAVNWFKKYVANPWIVVDDSTPITGTGVNVTKPSALKADLIAWYNSENDNYVVQDPATFAATCSVTDVGGGIMDLYAPVIVSGKIRVVNINLDFTTV